MLNLLRLSALAALLCALLPAGGDARPIDWRPATVATATPEPAVFPEVLPPPITRCGSGRR